MALLALPLLAGAGCQLGAARIHPRFAELCPREVAVMPVENRTVLDLSRASAAGLLQRYTIGAREVDVPVTLRQGLLEGLARKGYRTRLVETAAAGADGNAAPPPGAAPVEAVLHCELTEWRQAGVQAGGELLIGGRVELVLGGAAGGDGEVLFQADLHHRASSSGSPRGSAGDLASEVYRTGQEALADLPVFSSARPSGSRVVGGARPDLPSKEGRR